MFVSVDFPCQGDGMPKILEVRQSLAPWGECRHWGTGPNLLRLVGRGE